MGIRMGVGTNLKMLYTMKKLNRVLHGTTFSTRFISVFYCELHRHGGLLYTNAGHTSGLIITQDTVVGDIDTQLPPSVIGPMAGSTVGHEYSAIYRTRGPQIDGLNIPWRRETRNFDVAVHECRVVFKDLGAPFEKG